MSTNYDLIDWDKGPELRAVPAHVLRDCVYFLKILSETDSHALFDVEYPKVKALIDRLEALTK